jgi:Nitrile hydratase beta subunit
MQSEDLSRAAALLGGDVAWPAVDGEPVFDEPWQGRAFAMAFEVVERSGLPWDAFREQLVVAIADDPARPYYESWLVALERLTESIGAVDHAAVALARNRAASYRYHDELLGDVETFPFEPEAPHTHAELYRVWVDGAPRSWGMRMFNGDDVQVDVQLPSPSHSDRWDELRQQLLGLGPDPADQLGHA